MKINVITTEAGKIIARNTIIKLGVNPFDIEGTKVPISLYQKKGDLLVAKGYSNPAAIDVGSDGQVLVSDSTEATGVRWKTMQLGTITLSNSESFAVPSGSVVTQGTVSGTFRIATSADTTNLYVTSENILSGKNGVLYALNGTYCNVRVTDAAVAIGDKLAVSAIDGVAETTTGTHFAIAVTGKSAGQIGTVSCILVNTNTATLDVPGGGTGRQTLSSNNILVGNGVDPIKLIPTHKGVLYASGDGAEPTFTKPFQDNAGAHNSVYRGVSLGTSVSAAQYAAISAGTFEDMYIGDYWTIGDVVWRIAAFDYYLTTGDTACDTHHVVIVPDTNLYSHVMNDSNVTTGAYVGSKMYTQGLADAKTAINNAFGSAHILNHRNHLQNAVTNGRPSGGSWYDSTVELMTEENVYGCKVFAPVSDGSTVPNNYVVDKSQYPLFVHDPHMISNRLNYWLRDVVSAAGFANVGNRGHADYSPATYENGVRPAFSIIG